MRWRSVSVLSHVAALHALRLAKSNSEFIFLSCTGFPSQVTDPYDAIEKTCVFMMAITSFGARLLLRAIHPILPIFDLHLPNVMRV